jgi:LysM repeat protein
MEEELDSPASNLLPIALAVLALVLGGAGLYFGMSANQRISPISETLNAGTSSAAMVEKQVARFEEELATLSVQASELKKAVDRVRLYGSQSDQLAKQAVEGVKSNREELVKLAEQINAFTASSVRAQPNVPEVKNEATSTSISTVSATASQQSAGTYSIQSGDNFARIAAQKNVGLQALIDANPGVDPRRLQIGQQIKIPAN